MKPVRVQTVNQLKEYLSKGEVDFFIALRRKGKGVRKGVKSFLDCMSLL